MRNSRSRNGGSGGNNTNGSNNSPHPHVPQDGTSLASTPDPKNILPKSAPLRSRASSARRKTLPPTQSDHGAHPRAELPLRPSARGQHVQLILNGTISTVACWPSMSHLPLNSQNVRITRKSPMCTSISSEATFCGFI